MMPKVPSETPRIRAGVFASLPGLLSEADVDLQCVFDGLDIDLSTLRPDTMVPISELLTALDRSASATNCDHLGLLLGARFSLSLHGMIGRLMSSAPTLHQALLDFVTWQQAYSNSAVVYLTKFSDGVALGFGAYSRLSPGTRQLYDGVVAVGCKMAAELTEGKVRPAEILLSHRPPGDLRPYAKHLGAPISFDQHQTCVIFDRHALEFDLPARNPESRKRALADLEAAASQFIPRFASRVAHRIRPLLHESTPSLDDLAATLSLHPRTLRRYLKADGTTFEAIRDDVRYTVARELLAMTDMPIGEVGQAIAFGSHGAFIAAFHRWAGMPPSTWRARRLHRH